MTVKQLIAELKKQPQKLNVEYAHHDNPEWESAGDVFSVELFEKSDYISNPATLRDDRERFESMPDRVVILRG